MKWYHKWSFMVPFKFILIVQNNSEIFKSISYRYKFLVGARDPLIEKTVLIFLFGYNFFLSDPNIGYNSLSYFYIFYCVLYDLLF